jgi:hypothetical protein
MIETESQEISATSFATSAEEPGAPRSKRRDRSLRLRQLLFAEIPDDQLWQRKRHKGFTTVPRTMPLLMNVIDSLTKNQPAGQTYLALWCRTFDESLLVIENPLVLATESGFGGERALSTWRQRMRTLEELGFIQSQEGASGPFHYVLLLNPHVVVWKIKRRIAPALFRQLVDRAIDIGADDMKEPAVTEVSEPALKSRKGSKRAAA